MKERCPSAAISRAVKEVAGQLRNTPSVCRKCYLYPVVLDVFGEVLAVWNSGEHRLKQVSGLSSEEATLLQFLEQQKD